MSARDLIQEALHSLEANKGRSLLTILGIVIGIASVIAMTSLIGGIQNSLVNSLGLNAARMVQIYSSQELTESDIEKLQKLVPQIEQIGIVDSAYTEYKTGDKSYTVMAQGVDSDMLDAVGASKLVAGRTYSQAESQSGSRVALISRGGADQLYGNEQDALGKTIKVSNGEVQIVGPRGGPDWRFACTAGRRSSSSSWRRRTAWGRPPPRSSRGSRWARPRSGRRGTSRTATPGRAVESGRGNRHGRRPAWAPTSRSTPRRRPARSPGSTRTR